MYKSIAKKGAGLDGAVVESIRIEGDSIIVSARPRKRAPRCPVCGRRCDAYDRLPARRWRALDDGALKRYVEYAPTRVRCPEHGVRSEAVLWARSAASRFTRGFEDQVAWLACACSRSAVSELMRVDWHTVGGICARVAADGARWIADVVAERMPAAELAIDPFHAVSWCTDALDDLRRQAWRDARGAPRPKRRRGRPGKGEAAPADPARLVKGLRYPLLKNPGDLTERQADALGALKSLGTALWRGYLLKEVFRAVFRAGSEADAREGLARWLSWACRSRIPQFVELSRKVRRKAEGIVRSIALGVSNARVEAVNNKIKVAIRQAYGFRNTGNLMALVMLRCSPLRPSLPGREA